MKTNIPKIIHYVWVGGQEKPEAVLKCIDSWKKNCPDYTIMEWNENNFNIDNIQVRKALSEKNWAFASDIIRVWALYQYGGIYFDTDLELIKPIDNLLTYKAFFCYESPYWLGTAVLAAIPKHEIFKRIYERYEIDANIKFLTNPKTVHAFSAVLRYDKHVKLKNNFIVLENDVALLPRDYFYPLNYMTLACNITDNTYGIHYYKGSWHTKAQKRSNKFALKMRRIFGNTIFSWFEKMIADMFYLMLKKEYKKIDKQKRRIS